MSTEFSHLSVVWYDIGVDHPVLPDTPLPALPKIPRGALLILTGRSPIWRYAMALHHVHGSEAGAVACYDPKLGAVVVASHTQAYQAGNILDLSPPEADSPPPPKVE